MNEEKSWTAHSLRSFFLSARPVGCWPASIPWHCCCLCFSQRLHRFSLKSGWKGLPAYSLMRREVDAFCVV